MIGLLADQIVDVPITNAGKCAQCNLVCSARDTALKDICQMFKLVLTCRCTTAFIAE